MQTDLPRFDQACVLVIGDIMLDRYWQGETARISPEAPVPVVRIDQIVDRPGGAGNVALNIAALGVETRLAGYTGDDALADSLQALLASAGVNCAFTRIPGRETITKLRVVSRHQQLIRLDFEDATHPNLLPLPVRNFPAQLATCGVVVLSDYAKGALQQAAVLIAAARARNVPVLVDPKGADFSRYRGATLLTPNLQEFETVVGPCCSELELVLRARQLMAKCDLGALLVTRGEQGMTLLRGNEEPVHFPARARDVFDVTGAGDTVMAVLAAAIAAGSGLAEAVHLANLAAGIVVGKVGTAVVTAPELRRAMLEDYGPPRGVLNLEQLQLAVGNARSRGERLVFTNGCFDILHAGHVSFLQQARELGERLIVAVNGDQSVHRLKGTGRPINPEARRMAVLAGLNAVDWVVCFDADTPVDLLRTLQPDILVKGGDYRHKAEVVGWDLVEAYGGRVALLGMDEDVSTSAIVRQIKS